MEEEQTQTQQLPLGLGYWLQQWTLANMAHIHAPRIHNAGDGSELEEEQEKSHFFQAVEKF